MSTMAKRRVKKTFTFNLMVVGASGLGKTTFIKALMQNTGFNYSEPQETSNVQVFSSEIELDERKVQMTIIDTPGFGDKLDNTQCCQIVLNYVEEQFKNYLIEESKIQRVTNFLDSRVHAVLYFLDPRGHNLSDIDIEFMTTLGRSTNILPVLGRSDSVSEKELKVLKKKIMEQIIKNNLHIYNFPIYSDDDDTFIVQNNALEDLLPFAIVGSETFHEVNGTKVLGRKYPWGIVEVENPDHSDFTVVKNVLLKTHIEPLKDDTHEIHYEFFRKNDLIRQEKEKKNGDQAKQMQKDVLSMKEAEEEEMKARKRRSRISFVE